MPNDNETSGGVGKWRKRLHVLGFHTWSKWSETKLMVIKPMQTRRCLLCNKTQIRFIIPMREY